MRHGLPIARLSVFIPGSISNSTSAPRLGRYVPRIRARDKRYAGATSNCIDTVADDRDPSRWIRQAALRRSRASEHAA